MSKTADSPKPPTPNGSGASSGQDHPPVIYEDPKNIQRSPFNRLVDTKSQAFQELAESVRQRGIIEPLICRRVIGITQLIAGERRWKAALAVKLPDVPVIVREANDAEVIELQTIENEKREDLTPIEQAEKYQQLLDTYKKESDAGPAMTADQALTRLCDRIGKAKSTVYEALRLIKLPNEVKTALSKGELPASHAGLIAKLDGHPNAQQRMLKEIRHPAAWNAEEFNGKKILSFRQTKEVVEEETRLLAERDKWKTLAASHKKTGGVVLGEDGTASTGQEREKQGYVTDKDYNYTSSQYGKSYADLMGKQAPKHVLAHDIQWRPLKLYKKAEAIAAIEKNGHKKPKAGASKSKGGKSRSSAPKVDKAREKEIDRIRGERVTATMEEIVAKAEKTSGESAGLWLWILQQLADISGFSNTGAIGKRIGVKASYNPEPYLKKLKGKTGKFLRGITILALMPKAEDFYYSGSTEWTDDIIQACQTFGVKVPEFKIEVPKEKPKAAVKKPARKGKKR